MTPEHLAKEAARLLNDEVLLEAIALAQKDALGDLVLVDAGNTIEILRLQSRVKAFDEILSSLESMVLRMAAPGTGPVA